MNIVFLSPHFPPHYFREFFQTAADQYVALEVNMRPPGGFTTDMFNYACDIDIYRVWSDLLTHHRAELKYRRRLPLLLCQPQERPTLCPQP